MPQSRLDGSPHAAGFRKPTVTSKLSNLQAADETITAAVRRPVPTSLRDINLLGPAVSTPRPTFSIFPSINVLNLSYTDPASIACANPQKIVEKQPYDPGGGQHQRRAMEHRYIKVPLTLLSALKSRNTRPQMVRELLRRAATCDSVFSVLQSKSIRKDKVRPNDHMSPLIPQSDASMPLDPWQISISGAHIYGIEYGGGFGSS
ncbi:hypothetical protein CIHG_02128 [Coccidioides immitis H538.4]|uniref:Uncharacterized protein n=3 Tax=Coccidioides immitis TaxID=5501 RepID=A0A0J8RBG5_COCIT|nr:hypothetical protein CIRG_00300 [Coccidioides immitis RMSCC 2394]KMU81755.1 hypothetical protein CISG_02773 [Coccidioides immitis RMSCC 3703]KMU84342.1 hypothetical protein CIHG_02128 [Coccidioides immitis H538.4]